jgi:tRNA1(Val) A37 N6-methylase TrmN6
MSRDSSPDLLSEVTDDAVLGGRLRLLQPRRGHRFGHDAILLAAATAALPGDHVVELGAGVGAAGLALASRCAGCRVTLIEIDAQLTSLASDNAERNGLAQRVSAIALDVTGDAQQFAQAGLAPASIDRVLMNPPFHDAQRSTASPDASRRAAHIADDRSLDMWVKVALRLLRPGGSLSLIYRADALGDVLAALSHGFGALEVLPIHPAPGAAAIRVIVRAVKGSRGPLVVRPGFLLNDAAGKPHPEAERVLRGAAGLMIEGDAAGD